MFDLVVIGGGSGGVRAARLAAAAGARVALVEEGRLGGTCVNAGCIPKKLFAYSAHYADDFGDSAGFGWSAARPGFDLARLRDSKDREIARLNRVYRDLLEGAGAEVVEGRGRLTASADVEVDGRLLRCGKALVATGSRPWLPEVEGIGGAITSDDAFGLGRLPTSAVVVGGGYIAVEFASIFAGWGVPTTLVHRGRSILRRFDGAVADFVRAELEKKGVTFRLESRLGRVGRDPSGQFAELADGGGRLAADVLLCALGRVPATAGLGLEDAGVKLGPGGEIAVDEGFRTSREGVFALGDVIGRVALTPVAIAEAACLVAREFQGEDRAMDYEGIPTAVFCNPNMGSVGLTEEQARERKIDHGTLVTEFRHLRHTLSGSPERTMMKVVFSRADDRVLGMHMVGAEAGEIIQGFAAAMKCGLTRERLGATVGVHPTAAEEFVTL